MKYTEALSMGLAPDIDAWIHKWHTNEFGDVPIHEALGFSREEYSLFVESPQYLYHIERNVFFKLGVAGSPGMTPEEYKRNRSAQHEY